MESQAAAEMPIYNCHKQVSALKIKEIVLNITLAQQENRETDGSAMITPEDERFAPFKVDRDYVKKHDPQVGGYYVVYKDGYKSFSPADAFEEGYSLEGDGTEIGQSGNLSFGEAFDRVKNGAAMRLPSWKEDVKIRMQSPDENSKMTAPYLYVESRFGMVPWKETMIELFSTDWEVVE